MLIERRLMPLLCIALAIAFVIAVCYIWDDLQASWKEMQAVWEYIHPHTSEDKETSP